MTSILTNTSAMVALQTLRSTNSNLSRTQDMISSGKTVANAADNAAVWAISKVMSADVKAFQQISNSLNLGQSTVAVAAQAAETVTELMTEIKGRIVAAQEENVDRDKIQNDINALRDQIDAVVGAAQFNGLNLVNNTSTTAGAQNVNILASLDRSMQQVAAADITVMRQDLGNGALTAGTVSVNVGSGAAVADGDTGAVFTIQGNATTGQPEAGMTYQIASGALGGGLTSAVAYVARGGDSLQDVTNHLVARLNHQAELDNLDVQFNANATTAGQVDMTNNSGGALTMLAANVQQAATNSSENDGTVGGSLELLAKIDVTTNAGTDAALESIESLLQTAISAAADLGSARGRLENQANFISKLTDAMKSGIGTLVDADMEEASARLQALQVQQQLGTQALSIANQGPQQLLSLFQ
jgi:flagellin